MIYLLFKIDIFSKQKYLLITRHHFLCKTFSDILSNFISKTNEAQLDR